MAPGGTSSDNNGDEQPDGVMQETNIDGKWNYYLFTGTSMASPHVAAVAAMLYANGTATTPDDVKQALFSTALDLGAASYDSTYGWGLVQAADALAWGTVCTDDDGDGYDDAACGGTDCDDTDWTVYPGADEICGDGIDQNCDGVVDDGCSGTCTDNDGDSFCSDGEPPLDCDDTDWTVYPGAPEICSDGIDQDCDGVIDENCCAGFKEPCETDADCCSLNCFTKKGFCK